MIFHGDGNPRRCDSCGYPAALREYDAGFRAGKTVMLCEICEKTEIAQAYKTPSQYESEIVSLRTIGYVANRILDEIRKSR